METQKKIKFNPHDWVKPVLKVAKDNVAPSSNNVKTSKYGTQAIAIATKMIADCLDGNKHVTLRNAAYLLGGYVGGNLLSIVDATAALQDAIKKKSNVNSLEDALKTIDTCLQKGIGHPITKEQKEAERERYLQQFITYKPLTEDEGDSDIGSGHSLIKLSVIERLEEHLTKNYDFRLNEVTNRLDYKRKSASIWNVMVDFNMNSLIRELQKAGIHCSAFMLRITLFSDFTPRFNPFHDYFNGLPAWDGVDYIDLIASTVSTTNNDLWKKCFRKWIVALVAGLMDDKLINHTVIVFSGTQGIGKTTWILNLVPPVLSDYCYTGTINPGNKDTLINLSECMLINLDELENLNRTELGSLKEIITKAAIRIRRPYGYSNENMPRRATFAGSVNNKEFLSDITGSRRFLCFEVLTIDYRHAISIDKVYSQALHLFKAGFQYWFEPSEIAEINENNEQYRAMSVEEELLLTYFEPCTKEKAEFLISTTEIITHLRDRFKISINDSAKIKLGKALRAHNFLRLTVNDRKVWAIRERRPESNVKPSIYRKPKTGVDINDPDSDFYLD
jgi:predicted P-loop ATPase